MSYFVPIQFFNDEELTKSTLSAIFGKALNDARVGYQMNTDGKFLPSFHVKHSAYSSGYLLLDYEFFMTALGEVIKGEYTEYDLDEHELVYMSPSKVAKHQAAREVLVVAILERFYGLLSLNSKNPREHKGNFLRFHHYRSVEYGVVSADNTRTAKTLPFVIDKLGAFVSGDVLFDMRQFCVDLGVEQKAFR